MSDFSNWTGINWTTKGDKAAIYAPSQEYYDEEKKKRDFENKRQQIESAQIDQAKMFRRQLPNYTGRLQGLADEKMRNLFTGDVTNIRDQMNRRGLLHSGLRQGAELGAAAKRGSELARDKVTIADQLEKQAQEFENSATTNIMDNYRDKIHQADQAYDLALQRMKQRSEMMNSLWSAGGSVLGGYLGRKEG